MKYFLAAFYILLGAHASYSFSPEPADEREWDEVMISFSNQSFEGGTDGKRDGTRLLELDKEKAKKILLDFLDKSHPEGIRLKAINAIGWNGVQEGIDPLIEIIENTEESPRMRHCALNPGLRYMNDPRAEAVAISLVERNNRKLLRSYIWVLSGHGSSDSIDALEKCIPIIEEEYLSDVINALNSTNDAAVSRIVFENVNIYQAKMSERLLRSYAISMRIDPIPEAKETMMELVSYEDKFVQLYSLQFFRSYPNDKVSNFLIQYLESEKKFAHKLEDTVSAFIESDLISDQNKNKLQILKEKLYATSAYNNQLEALFGRTNSSASNELE